VSVNTEKSTDTDLTQGEVDHVTND